MNSKRHQESAAAGAITVVDEPSFYVLGFQGVDDNALATFLGDHGVTRYETDATQGGERLCEVAGRLCYWSFERRRPGGIRAYLHNMVESGHGSVLEHIVFQGVLTGISRNCSHELVRHRTFEVSQLSDRYVDARDRAFILNDLFAHPEHADLRRRWREHVAASLKLYDDAVREFYGRLTADHPDPGSPTREQRTALRKRARECARDVLPGCAETRIFLTMNGRAIRNFLELRCSPFAAWEIRRAANAVWHAVRPLAPHLFADYTAAELPDGTFTLSTPYRKV